MTLFPGILTSDDINYAQSIITNATYKQSTVDVDGKFAVCMSRKSRLDYTLSPHECAYFDHLVPQTTDCTQREQWRILRYDGSETVFRGPHIDWHSCTPHRKTSIVIGLSSCCDYEGGELRMFDDQNNVSGSHKLDIGTAIVFDSKVVHEVAPVTGGVRYVLQSFMLSDDAPPIVYHTLLHDTHFAKYKKWCMKQHMNATNYTVGYVCDIKFGSIHDVMTYVNATSYDAFNWMLDGTLVVKSHNKLVPQMNTWVNHADVAVCGTRR